MFEKEKEEERKRRKKAWEGPFKQFFVGWSGWRLGTLSKKKKKKTLTIRSWQKTLYLILSYLILSDLDSKLRLSFLDKTLNLRFWYHHIIIFKACALLILLSFQPKRIRSWASRPFYLSSSLFLPVIQFIFLLPVYIFLSFSAEQFDWILRNPTSSRNHFPISEIPYILSPTLFFCFHRPVQHFPPGHGRQCRRQRRSVGSQYEEGTRQRSPFLRSLVFFFFPLFFYFMCIFYSMDIMEIKRKKEVRNK